jgi:dipeptidyl aminopeptidase/acylaminoacyl peptidase
VKLRYVLYAVLIIAALLGAYFLGKSKKTDTQISVPSIIHPRTLDRYTIDNLAKTEIKGSQIILGEKLFEASLYSSLLFSFSTDSDLDGRAPKKVTGLINLPKGQGPFPVVMLLRGYVDQETYTTGAGSKRAGEYFAQNGFITLAPDYLGYGGSDKEAENIFESRFQTYVTTLSLLGSLDSLAGWDGENIFIWGHSNGGQIALTVLEISQGTYPTVLWAPVSAPFPYSILFYTDESDDKGKLIRRELAKFEDTYDVELYSTPNYYDRIKAPVSLHQGSLDPEVPKAWSDELFGKLEKLNSDSEYFLYPGADHNLNPFWDSAILRSLTFFQKQIK